MTDKAAGAPGTLHRIVSERREEGWVARIPDWDLEATGETEDAAREAVARKFADAAAAIPEGERFAESQRRQSP